MPGGPKPPPTQSPLQDDRAPQSNFTPLNGKRP